MFPSYFLSPGDVIVDGGAGNGHAMLYIGNGEYWKIITSKPICKPVHPYYPVTSRESTLVCGEIITRRIRRFLNTVSGTMGEESGAEIFLSMGC